MEDLAFLNDILKEKGKALRLLIRTVWGWKLL